MAERRMFSRRIVSSDYFLDLSPKAQILYYQLSMNADDDGVVDNVKSVMRLSKTDDECLNELLVNKYVLKFDVDGKMFVVIKDWKINNYIQKDRYHETIYNAVKTNLDLDGNGSYIVKNMDVYNLYTDTVHNSYTENREDKATLELDKSESDRCFTPPTLEEVTAYCLERKNGINPQRFIDYYQSRGWGNIKDWKAKIRSWESTEYGNSTPAPAPAPKQCKTGMPMMSDVGKRFVPCIE